VGIKQPFFRRTDCGHKKKNTCFSGSVIPVRDMR
jgi:hypothetical protein